MTLAAGREHYLFVDTTRCTHVALGLFRQSLWLGQIGPPPVCKSMSMSLGVQLFMSLLFLEPAPHMYTYAFLHYAVGCFMSLF